MGALQDLPPLLIPSASELAIWNQTLNSRFRAGKAPIIFLNSCRNAATTNDTGMCGWLARSRPSRRNLEFITPAICTSTHGYFDIGEACLYEQPLQAVGREEIEMIISLVVLRTKYHFAKIVEAVFARCGAIQH